MDEIDIYRAARLLVDKHDAEAPFHTAMRINELIEAGDIEGVAVWKRVLKAVEELLSAGGGTVH
jgi:hypothetical protein